MMFYSESVVLIHNGLVYLLRIVSPIKPERGKRLASIRLQLYSRPIKHPSHRVSLNYTSHGITKRTFAG